MTYDSEPTRWTDAPNSAPDSLRDAFRAAHNEGPNELQMRALALKLAAMSGGAALAANASAAHASTTGTAATSSGALSIGKIALSIALVSAVSAGTALYRTRSAPNLTQRDVAVSEGSSVDATSQVAGERAVVVAQAEANRREAAAPVAPSASRAVEPQRHELASDDVAAAPPNLGIEVRHEPKVAERAEAVATSDSSASERRRELRHERSARKPRASAVVTTSVEHAVAAAEPRRASSESERTLKVRSRSATELQTPEIELLRRARENLDARPRETFRLTEQHRREYPEGVFAQERDALAIEALLRAGELGQARARAEDFVDSYPTSPHAHRFRETMKLP